MEDHILLKTEGKSAPSHGKTINYFVNTTKGK